MSKLASEIKNRIAEIKNELKDIAIKLDIERKESVQDEDNNVMTELLDKKGLLEEQLFNLEKSLSEIPKATHNHKLDLGVGAVVDFNGEKRNMTLVSSAQADPTKGLISMESPLGQALVGKKKGDKIEFSTPAGNNLLSILQILTL